MSGPSFEKIDYQLRYNKHIERRLIFDLLKRAQNLLDFAAHGYLGFGSMWFADFRLAHRVLELSKMYSMEREDYADRATFNQPFNSIKVVGGDCSETLKSFDAEYWQAPHIAWLDYDGRLTSEVVHDLYLFLDRCAPNSVITVTVNGGWRNYRPALIKKDQVRGRKETSLGQIEALLGANVVPPRFEPGPPNAAGVSQDILESQFAEFLAEALLVALSHRLASSGRQSDGQPLHFVPLFNFCHEDGVEMVTIGGAVVKDQDRAVWLNQIRQGVPLNQEGNLPLHQRLDLVPLTLKEKITLDACLPQAQTEFVLKARADGIKLRDSELGKYWAYHRQFPTFFESPV
jgi:hypothetical protein